jgi:hypothetical protein
MICEDCRKITEPESGLFVVEEDPGWCKPTYDDRTVVTTSSSSSISYNSYYILKPDYSTLEDLAKPGCSDAHVASFPFGGFQGRGWVLRAFSNQQKLVLQEFTR